MKDIGVYTHIPFCLRKCNYCDFCSFPQRQCDFDAYTDELCRRIAVFASENGVREAQTVYFGGGTPSLLPLTCFERIMSALRKAFVIAEDAEITVECNPATIDENGFAALRALGINRVSMGLQSAEENELKLLGRMHSFDGFCDSFKAARRAGFDNISIDLMYGIPDQSVESFKKTIERVIELSPEHISAYGLKIEEGTAFARMRDTLKLPNEDDEFEMYTTCKQMLAAAGYERYEISNFAKVGRESRHNLRYWQIKDYIGFGVAAHSCVDGVRFGNSRDIDAFLRGEDIVEERSVIDSEELVSEYVMLGLRLSRGICAEEYKSLSGRELEADMPMIKSFLALGFLQDCGGRIFFTDKGFFVSNAILAQLLDQLK